MSTHLHMLRSKQGEESFSLQALCFYLDHIDFTAPYGCQSFNNLEEFLNKFESYISSCPLAIQTHHSKLKVLDMESLIDFFQQLEYVCFTPLETQVEVSNLPAPNYFAKESIFGYFIRNLIVEWESYDFDQICDVYTAYQTFCESISKELSLLDQSSDITHPNNPFQLELTRMLNEGDISQALDRSHAYFDLSHGSSQNTLQQALLTQARILIHGSHYSSARVTLEEVIKIAHARNDHVSIAKAMELLYHTTCNAKDNGSSEELLISCIDKYAQLKIHGAAAKSSLFLVSARAYSHHHHVDTADIYLMHLWTLMQTSLLGDSKLLVNLIHHPNDLQPLKSAFTTSDVSIAKADRPLTANEVSDVFEQYFTATMDLWLSRNRYALAIQSGQRLLHRFCRGAPLDINGVLGMTLRLARLIAKTSCSLFFPDNERITVNLPAEDLVRCVSELSLFASIYLLREMGFSALYVRGISLLENWERTPARITALALTDQLMHTQLESNEYYFDACILGALLRYLDDREGMLRELSSLELEARESALLHVQVEVQRIRRNVVGNQ